MTSPLRVEQLTVGPLEENCWLLADSASRTAVLVDPGDEPDVLLDAVARSGCTLAAIWLTHAHFDHVGAVAAILRAQQVPVRLHALDLSLYRNAASSAMRFGLVVENPPEPTRPWSEGDIVRLGEHAFEVWHLPGHAPGHVALVGSGLCISGDLLFEGSIGRTDLPLCDPSAMQRSLGRLALLSPGLQVLTGHGRSTTIERECAQNPFLRGLARPVGS